jgi:hypothetical protein
MDLTIIGSRQSLPVVQGAGAWADSRRLHWQWLPLGDAAVQQSVHRGDAINQCVALAEGRLILVLSPEAWPTTLDVQTWPENVFGYGALGAPSCGSWLVDRYQFLKVGGCHGLLRDWGLIELDLRGRLEAQGCIAEVFPDGSFEKLHVSALPRSQAAELQAQQRATQMADTALLVSHPWSIQQTADLAPALQRKWHRIWRITFWSIWLEIPSRLVRDSPESWFPSTGDHSVPVQRWHRCYWWLLRGWAFDLEALLVSLACIGGRR